MLFKYSVMSLEQLQTCKLNLLDHTFSIILSIINRLDYPCYDLLV